MALPKLVVTSVPHSFFEETTQTFPQTVELGLDLSELLDQAEGVFPDQRLDAGSEHDQASSQGLKLVPTIHGLSTVSNCCSSHPGCHPRSHPENAAVVPSVAILAVWCLTSSPCASPWPSRPEQTLEQPQDDGEDEGCAGMSEDGVDQDEQRVTRRSFDGHGATFGDKSGPLRDAVEISQ